jgi:hypothetical protein
LELSNEEEKAI